MKIKVQVDIGGIQEVKDAYKYLRFGYANRLIKSGAIKAGRRTVPTVKRYTNKNKRTGMLEKSRGHTYKVYKKGNIWVVLVGARTGMWAYHPFWKWIKPTRYDHLLEGGRKEVVAGTSTDKKGNKNPTGKNVLAIKVKRIDPARRFASTSSDKGASMPGKQRLNLQTRFRGNLGNALKDPKKRIVNYEGKNWSLARGKKVSGGYIIFAQRAAPVLGVMPVENSEPTFRRLAPQAIIDEIRNGLPHLLSKFGNRIFK